MIKPLKPRLPQLFDYYCSSAPYLKNGKLFKNERGRQQNEFKAMLICEEFQYMLTYKGDGLRGKELDECLENHSLNAEDEQCSAVPFLFKQKGQTGIVR